MHKELNYAGDLHQCNVCLKGFRLSDSQSCPYCELEACAKDAERLAFAYSLEHAASSVEKNIITRNTTHGQQGGRTHDLIADGASYSAVACREAAPLGDEQIDDIKNWLKNVGCKVAIDRLMDQAKEANRLGILLDQHFQMVAELRQERDVLRAQIEGEGK